MLELNLRNQSQPTENNIHAPAPGPSGFLYDMVGRERSKPKLWEGIQNHANTTDA